ncbi:LOW QUALITY PROTEIN: D site albumin promoter binding protein b [Notolabrus celidotus]|uniref:LOW QUALITY PROTEIN: D site albumin promoter binding protein b n=1 Tax=Notolabrus celidotus TaxID=1203425 RepID=UPI00148FB98E|nr:LOW QUALITY PROTEIN: D site albumin promoter binding protein b [Notolabrus celidotus]
MSRQLTQLPTPDLPAGASPQFGSCTQPAGSLTGGHLNSMTGLKSLLQHPMKGEPAFKKSIGRKDKDRLDLDEDSLGVCSMRNGSGIGSSNSSNGCGGGNGGGSFNQFLGPLLWDRTLPADGGLFQLQYMDLEEFLTENGMGSMHNNNSSSSAQIPSQSSQSAVPNQSSQCLPPSSPPCSTSSSPSSSSSPSLLGLEVAQPQNLTGGNDFLHGSQTSMNDSCESPCSSSSSSCPPLLTPTGSGPDAGMFDMDSNEMSSSPSQQNFDPRRHSFSEEELKPQPMIKKARKILVPDNLKDEKYWTRRYKNNEAAKRSRDARRLKENQISVRAAYLERENAALRQEVAEIRKELGRCRNILSKYENRLPDQ